MSKGYFEVFSTKFLTLSMEVNLIFISFTDNSPFLDLTLSYMICGLLSIGFFHKNFMLNLVIVFKNKNPSNEGFYLAFTLSSYQQKHLYFYLF
jgi:hypothetical protein